jgi:hypothetical protein
LTVKEFVENIYIEKQNYLKKAFDRSNQKLDSAVKIKELDLDNEQTQKQKNIISIILDDIIYTLLLGLDGETSIGNAMQQNYKIFDENDNLLYDHGELELAAYEYFHGYKYEIKNYNYSIIGIIKNISKKNITNGEDMVLEITGTNNHCIIDFFGRDIVFADEIVTAGIKFNTINGLKEQLEYEMKFKILLNNIVIGDGKIKEIINEELRKI